MPGPNTITFGNIKNSFLLSVTLSPTSFSVTVSEQTFTVTGIAVGDFINISKPSLTANVSLGNSRVSAANVLAITFVNGTPLVTVTPTAAEVYTIGVDRPDSGETMAQIV